MSIEKHVITGAQCTGKTATIEALEKRGFTIIPEIPKIIIEEQNKIDGDIVPWKNLEAFNNKVNPR